MFLPFCLFKETSGATIFDCCKQSLNLLNHPPTHSTHPPSTKLRLMSNFYFINFKKLVFGRADTNKANAQNLETGLYRSCFTFILSPLLLLPLYVGASLVSLLTLSIITGVDAHMYKGSMLYDGIRLLVLHSRIF